MMEELTELAADLRSRADTARNYAGTLPVNKPEAIAARGKARGFAESADAVSRLVRLQREAEARR